jgi:hypothetical protein
MRYWLSVGAIPS